MSIFQIVYVKSSKALGLLLAVIASFALLVPVYAHDSLKTVLSRRVVGKTVVLTVRDVETGKIETITGQTGHDSLVVMKDPAKASLPTKPIEQVRAGQWVPTRNPLTGKTEYKRVKRTFVHTVPTIVALRLADANTGNVLETLKGTPEHPFFTTDKGMVGMGHLRVGEKVISRTGPALMVASVIPESKPGGYKVYNFEVVDDHTYFVGRVHGGTWVHNNCTTIAAAVTEKFGIFDCVPCAEALVKAFQKQNIAGEVIELEGGVGKHLNIVSGTLGYQVIATNGRHVGVRVGDTVYDNIHKAGIPYADWLKDFDAIGGVRVKMTTPF